MRHAMVVLPCALLCATFGLAQTQEGAPPQANETPQLLPAPQLDNLVAPVALYPDQLLSQVLAASTYPLEIVEAGQWFQQNRNLRGQQLVEAAQQQNWDPSVQALVAFPDVLTMLNRDIRWTTDLGNAFLTQQADVMNAVQRMRASARSNGRLADTAQQTVTVDQRDGQSAIEIQPADPQVVYVPVYNPAYIWGPPAWGAYPSLWYPSYGFGFGPACYLGGLFAGFGGFGGWGWGFGWFGHSLFVNGPFFSHYGFRGYGGYGGFGGRSAWAHDPGHRLGIAYPNRAVASRFGGNGFSGRANGYRAGDRAGDRGGMSGGSRSFNGNARTPNSGASSYNRGGSYRGGSPGYGGSGGSNGSSQAYRGSSGFATQRTAPSYRGGSPNYGGSGGSNGSSQGYRGSSNFAPQRTAPNYRGGAPSDRGSAGGGFAGRGSAGGYSGQSFAGRQQTQAPRYSASSAPAQRYASPGSSSRSFAAPSQQHYSAPHSSAPHYSAPHSSAPHSSGSRSAGGSSSSGHSGGSRRN